MQKKIMRHPVMLQIGPFWVSCFGATVVGKTSFKFIYRGYTFLWNSEVKTLVIDTSRVGEHEKMKNKNA